MMTKKVLKFYATASFLILLLITQGTTVFSQKIESQFPEPTVIQPGKNGKAPSDAIVLFDKDSLSKFESSKNGGPAPWKVNGEQFTVVPGTGAIQTKEKFSDCQLHIEWKTPLKDVQEGKVSQANGNSGIFFMGNYEVQVLNSFINKTYPDGQAGAIYKQYPPLVNASLEPEKWQVYEIIFTAPRFNSDGSQKTPGYFTVLHNGVLIQNHVEIKGPTRRVQKEFPVNQTELPLQLQDHSHEVSFRNIWIRKL